jgi:plastocyanin domain-containing protein
MRLLLVLGVSGLASLSFLTAGCDKKPETKAESAASASPAPANGGGATAITVDSDGFKPNAVKLKKGAPATLVFTRTTDETCATEVVFPQLDIKKELPRGTPVTVTVPTDKEQTLTFQCGMGMYKSSVVVAN